MTKDSFLETCKNLLERELKPTVPEVLPLVRFYCGQAEGLGGELHIFVEDGNCDDNHIEMCKKDSANNGDLLAFSVCEVLLKMSKTQRRAIYGAGYEEPTQEHTEPEHDPVPDFSNESQEKYFPIAQLEKISGGLPPIDLSNLFATGSCFRKENVLFKVDSINNKKGTVTLKIEGIFGAIEGEQQP